MTDEMKEQGCSCHNHPPCSFCTELTEEEGDIFWNGGMSALQEYWRESKNENNDLGNLQS